MQAEDLHDRGAQGMVISPDPYIKGHKEGEQVKNPRFTAEVSGVEGMGGWGTRGKGRAHCSFFTMGRHVCV